MKAKTGAFIAAQALAVVVVLALVSLPIASQNDRSTTFSSTNSSSTIVSPGISPDGLQLEIVLNSTSMRVNGSIGGSVAVVNTLATQVTVVAPQPSQNMSNWSNYINICPSNDFLGYAVFDGPYSADNVSQAGPPLALVEHFITSCPIPYYVPGPITFRPRGDSSGQSVFYAQQPSSTVDDRLPITTVFCNTTESGPQSFGCSYASPGLVGYWVGDPASARGDFGFTSPAFVRLPPGVYTIMAWDVWNQYVFARVLVTGAVG